MTFPICLTYFRSREQWEDGNLPESRHSHPTGWKTFSPWPHVGPFSLTHSKKRTCPSLHGPVLAIFSHTFEAEDMAFTTWPSAAQLSLRLQAPPPAMEDVFAPAICGLTINFVANWLCNFIFVAATPVPYFIIINLPFHAGVANLFSVGSITWRAV